MDMHDFTFVGMCTHKSFQFDNITVTSYKIQVKDCSLHSYDRGSVGKLGSGSTGSLVFRIYLWVEGHFFNPV